MRIAILTPNMDRFDDAYSVVHVVRSQVAMLSKAGYDVVIFVNQHCFDEPLRGDYFYQILPVLPDFEPTDGLYCTTDLANKLVNWLADFDLVFTHDWVSSSRLRAYAEALRLTLYHQGGQRFLHWTHSIPTLQQPWWDLEAYGDNHWLVYPTQSDIPKVATQFRVTPEKVLYIPHPVDIRLGFGLSDATLRLIDKNPGLISAEFAQVYPVDAGRMQDKGLKELIRLFGGLKRAGKSVCLVIVDGWNGNNPKEDKEPYFAAARRNGLNHQDFAFVSDTEPENWTGYFHEDLMDMLRLSTIFAFPTAGESFGMVMPEAILSGASISVYNGCLDNQVEMYESFGIPAQWPSCNRMPVKGIDLVEKIIEASESDKGFQGRKWVRQTLNMDTIYDRFYEPIINGLEVRAADCASEIAITSDSHQRRDFQENEIPF